MIIESNKSSTDDDVTWLDALSVVPSMAFNSIQIVVCPAFGVGVRKTDIIWRIDSVWVRERKTITLPIRLI